MRVIVHAVPGYQVISTVRDSRIETGEKQRSRERVTKRWTKKIRDKKVGIDNDKKVEIDK